MSFRYSSRREFLKHASALSATSAIGLGSPFLPSAAAAPDDPPSSVGKQAVACSRREAADAARDILLRGGNAVDAAAAALAVQCVIDPSNVGFGGYASTFVMYEAKTGKVHAIDADARAPQKFDPTTYTEESALQGYLAMGVPGVVAGFDLALQEFGTLPFKEIAVAALKYADDGFSVSSSLAQAFASLASTTDPVSLRAYFPGGVPVEGATWTQPDLARFLRRLGDEGLGSFYSGDIADAIVRQVLARGGALTDDDFHSYHATLAKPLHINYRGYDIYTPPPPSGGLTSLSILKTLEQFPLGDLPKWGARYIELFAGASNLTWAERFKYIGDPEFVEVPVTDMLSEAWAKNRAEQIRSGAVGAIVPPPAGPSHTVNIAVVDKQGNAVSWTATHGGDFGSHVAIEGLGLMLGHGMSRFAVQPGDPNYPAPRKRPQHNMSPLVVVKDGKARAALGLPGGRFIVTVTAQLAVSLIDFKASPHDIVGAPRVHTEGREPIQVSGTPQATIAELRRLGHTVTVPSAMGGVSNAIVIDAKNGDVRAASSNNSLGVAVL